MKMAKITYIVEQYGACAWYRCHTPGRALVDRGHDVVMDHAPPMERLAASDVLVLQRPSRQAAAQLADVAVRDGKTVVVDIDDDLWNIHRSNPAANAWTPDRLGVLESAIRVASVVTVSTPELGERVRGLNRRVVVVPNMLPAHAWPEVSRLGGKNSERLTVGWAGSISHLSDLMLLAGVPQAILERFPHVDFAFAGPREVPFGHHERIHIVPPVDIEEYPTLLMEFDIGIAPVTDTRFNHCKSDLKYLEYSMVGVPTVASRTATYERSVKHGMNGFLARNAKDWIKYLGRLIEDDELRADMGVSARKLAESRTIERHVEDWERAFGIA